MKPNVYVSYVILLKPENKDLFLRARKNRRTDSSSIEIVYKIANISDAMFIRARYLRIYQMSQDWLSMTSSKFWSFIGK